MEAEAAALAARALTKRYRLDGALRQVLRGLDLTVAAGEVTVVSGAPGAGKTTLVRVLTALDRPTSGVVLYGGLPAWRRTWLGWRLRPPRRGYALPLFKDPTASLDPVWPLWRTVTEAACAVGVIQPRSTTERHRVAEELFARAGLPARHVDSSPKDLTRAQCQRVAVLRLAAARPAVVAADEPTAGLDDAEATGVAWQLRNLADAGVAVLVTAGQPGKLGELSERVLVLSEGRIEP